MTLLHSHSTEETVQAGRSFASRLHGGDIVACTGELGAGKTHFIAGVCEALGVQSRVSSPTFTIINEYQAGKVTLVHIDLYRISTSAELANLGIEEYFNERCVCLIEWAERMLTLLPRPYFSVTFTHGEEQNIRRIAIEEEREGIERAGGVAV